MMRWCRVRLQSLFLTGSLFAIFLIAGCAHPTGTPALNYPQNELWAGRISLQVQSEPPQAFFAGFELKGGPETGQLTLTSPIGSTLGILRWSPGEATLESGGTLKKFTSVDELLEQTTGAAIPLSALFDWLKGKNTELDGWTADLSQQSTGKISARRSMPAPQTDLRVVLEQ